MRARFEPIVGRYMHLDLFGRPHRIYVEEAGEGTPLLCLHTAGSDGRQYRALMNDARVTAKHRVIAFDMPWHGKSSPPAGWHDEEYQLTSAQYTAMMLEISAALELDKPILIGCSIGGRICAASGARTSRTLSRHHRPAGRRACRSLLRSEFPAPCRRAWRRGRRRHRLRPGRARCAGEREVGNAVALHAKRSRRLQGRSLFLQARRRHPRPRRRDRHKALPVVPAVRRIRLFLHAGGDAWRWRAASRAARSPS